MKVFRKKSYFVLLVWLVMYHLSYGEAMLQLFNVNYRELVDKMPELAEAGYQSLWLPPPTKGSGGLSVGYDCWDRFDLGSKDQRGSVSTRYGTEADLIEAVKVAHRFGIRVYFDNVMNHNAFDVPGYNESVPIDAYPGFLPEDFHLRLTEEGYYRKWDNTRDWGNEWQVQNLGLSDLIDIATEPGTTNYNHGNNEGDTFPKISFLRQPSNPEYYCYVPTTAGQRHANGEGTYVGFGSANGITAQILADNEDFYSEYVEEFLHRAARWQLDRTKCDGYRLDAVKHTPADFYGATYGEDKDSSNYGYSGQIQLQYNLTRGFSDWDNHRDTVFNTEVSRDDAMLFGEHLGQPPAFGPYMDSGMRLVDNDLRSQFNNFLGESYGDLSGYDNAGAGGFAPGVGVMHAQSHDNDFAKRRELQHAYYFTREGLPLVYSDGNYQSETLGDSGGAFPRHANTAYLGQFGDDRLPNLMYMHQHFARGYQSGRWSDNDFIAYERIDKTENGAMSDEDAVVGLFMMNDNYASGQSRSFTTNFPSTSGGDNAYLYQYARGYGSQTGFYTWASDLGSVIVDPGSYFYFSYRTPERSTPWTSAGGKPLTLLQNGQPADSLTVIREDGPDGDSGFDGPNANPGFHSYGADLANADSTDYAYEVTLPRVTDATNLSFIVRADGSAENILLKLDGGIDLNGTSGGDPANRDNPPALATDQFLGYEQPTFVNRAGPEKFAATDTSRCTIGSLGSESWETTVGSASVSRSDGSGSNPTPTHAVAFNYHDASAALPVGIGTGNHYQETGGNIDVYVKTPAGLDGYEGALYYTTDGATFPEGGVGLGANSTTLTAAMSWAGDADGGSWWKGTISPAPANGTMLRYKAGIFRSSEGGLPLASVFPSGPGEVALKTDMTTTFRVDGFDGTTIQHFPHNDYQKTPDQASFVMQTGLDEGFHIIRGRAFLKRDGKASLFNTFQQTFYYDAERPQGEIVFPTEGETVGGQTYGAVVRTDNSVREVWYYIDDGAGPNDDDNTGTTNGNGVGKWVQANEVQPSTSIASAYPREWRFDYINIPGGNIPSTIQVRLVEASSADQSAWSGTVSTADDTNNWYTTLTRNVTASGPDLQLFVAFPPNDGDVVSAGYVMKAYFSKSLADGVSEAQLLSEFLVKIASQTSGSPNGAVTQDPSGYSISYNETADYHALSFSLPNLYNGDPDFLHHIGVTHERSGLTLTASRLVKAFPVEETYLSITYPPEVDSDGRTYEVVLPAVASPAPEQREVNIVIETDSSIQELNLVFEVGSGTTTLDSTETIGNRTIWTYLWSNVAEGQYRVRADGKLTVGGSVEASQQRNITVVYRQELPEVANDPDDDDDGLTDVNETTDIDFPQTNPETWTNSQVHAAYVLGNSSPTTPDTDGDLLPDALEVGWRTVGASDQGESFTDSGYDDPDTVPVETIGANNLIFDWKDTNDNGLHDSGEPSEPFADSDSDGVFDYGTIMSRDTDGDGTNNFAPDLDPPFYNTVPDNYDLPNYNFNAGRGDLIHGGVTNPQNPDTDGDGIRDGIEDGYNPDWATGTNYDVLVHNGWVDGDGDPLDPNEANPNNRGSWPNGKMDTGETWLETDPNNPDSDGDGLSDGYGEDKDLDGLINGDTNRNRIYDTGEAWSETNPLNKDTDGDGLLDGWETQNGLDPLDNGTDNLATATPGDGDPDQGATGDPDGDGFTNTQEQLNATKPLIDDSSPNLTPNSIVIGPGTAETVGSATNNNEFTDWTCADLVAFDEYEGAGFNNQSGDTYLAYDGYDTSRDIVAFYARDGEADGNYYFRLDLYDLQAFAEDANLDIYVVIDTGNTSIGEAALPDDVDIITDMLWEAVVACYSGNSGRVYIDTNPASNSINENEDLTTYGVIIRDQNTQDGFGQAYYNSELDSVEFSISRQALLDAGWNGINKLNFQVFTTRDGTQNSPEVGAGDIGGRNDIRDTIYDDWLAEDRGDAQENIKNNGKLYTAIGADGSGLYPDSCKKAKLILLAHANQANEASSVIHPLINTGFGTGYHRLLDVHQAYGQKLTLHMTPSMASAIEWASVDPAAGVNYLDGPTFNGQISSMLASGDLELLGTTQADHILPYFTDAFNSSSASLASQTLTSIYGSAPSSQVFWTPERVADHAVFQSIANMGYEATFVDQMRHYQKWQGRNAALGDDGYRLNRYHGVTAFIINDFASQYTYENAGEGLPYALRNLYHRKATSGTQDQVVTLFHQGESFGDPDNANAYNSNLRWIANRPWIQVVSPDQILNNQVDITRDDTGDAWYVLDQGTPTLERTAFDWLDHATQENYDNWYHGQTGLEQSLASHIFEVRSGVNLPQAFGEQGINDGLLADSAWAQVNALASLTSPLGLLARTTAFNSMRLTAFHDVQNHDTTKFSNGDYVYPDTDYNGISQFALEAHAQMRKAGIYAQVEAWQNSPPASAQAESLDVDLDGENEYILKNPSTYAIFEAIGGRLIAAWAREASTGLAYQVVGNLTSHPGTATEEEGETNNTGSSVNARRTSGFKDWFATGSNTSAYINDLYSVTAGTGASWVFTSSDGAVSKTITLPDSGGSLNATYTLGGTISALYVRFGLSPNLNDLLVNGQANLSGPSLEGSTITLTNSSGTLDVSAKLDLGAGTSYNASATDKTTGTFEPSTILMRNQAQTQQVEIAGTGTFSISLEPTATEQGGDNDGLPDDWEIANGLDPNDDGSTNPDNGSNGDPDGDGITNIIEYLVGLNPQSDDDHLFPQLTISRDPADGSIDFEFPTIPDRLYQIEYSPDLTPASWAAMGAPYDSTSQPANPTYSAISDNGAPDTPTHPNDEPRRFYRLRISLP